MEIMVHYIASLLEPTDHRVHCVYIPSELKSLASKHQLVPAPQLYHTFHIHGKIVNDLDTCLYLHCFAIYIINYYKEKNVRLQNRL